MKRSATNANLQPRDFNENKSKEANKVLEHTATQHTKHYCQQRHSSRITSAFCTLFTSISHQRRKKERIKCIEDLFHRTHGTPHIQCTNGSVINRNGLLCFTSTHPCERCAVCTRLLALIVILLNNYREGKKLNATDGEREREL